MGRPAGWLSARGSWGCRPRAGAPQYLTAVTIHLDHWLRSWMLNRASGFGWGIGGCSTTCEAGGTGAGTDCGCEITGCGSATNGAEAGVTCWFAVEAARADSMIGCVASSTQLESTQPATCHSQPCHAITTNLGFETLCPPHLSKKGYGLNQTTTEGTAMQQTERTVTQCIAMYSAM